MGYVTGGTIRILREKRKLTQKELAEIIHVSDKTISKWETDKGCGITLPKQEPEPSGEDHLICVETVDDEHFVTMDHQMGKEHYVSFVAYVTAGSLEIAKLYPEQDVSVRFRKKGHGFIYAYCNKHGMFRIRI